MYDPKYERLREIISFPVPKNCKLASSLNSNDEHSAVSSNDFLHGVYTTPP
jgi:hypothetical protein